MDYFKSKPTLTDKHNSSSSLNWWNWCSFVYESSRISAIKSFWSHQCIPHSRGHDLYTEKMTHPAIPEGISILIQTATPLTTFLIEKALGNFQNWGVSCFWGTVTFSMANGDTAAHCCSLLEYISDSRSHPSCGLCEPSGLLSPKSSAQVAKIHDTATEPSCYSLWATQAAWWCSAGQYWALGVQLQGAGAVLGMWRKLRSKGIIWRL